jgi:hypothetical protein
MHRTCVSSGWTKPQDVERRWAQKCALIPGAMENYWLLVETGERKRERDRDRETQREDFKSRASGKLTKLQRKATQARLHGQHKVDLITVKGQMTTQSRIGREEGRMWEKLGE